MCRAKHVIRWASFHIETSFMYCILWGSNSQLLNKVSPPHYIFIVCGDGFITRVRLWNIPDWFIFFSVHPSTIQLSKKKKKKTSYEYELHKIQNTLEKGRRRPCQLRSPNIFFRWTIRKPLTHTIKNIEVPINVLFSLCCNTHG